MSVCEWAVFGNKLDMNYNHQAKFGVTHTKMSKMRQFFLIILEKFFSSNLTYNSLSLSWQDETPAIDIYGGDKLSDEIVEKY